MKRKVLIALLCVTALCWLCAGALAEKIYDTAEVNFDPDGINQWMTVQVYPGNSGVYVDFNGVMSFHAYGNNDYVFAGYRVYDENHPVSGDSSDPYAQFGTAVEGIGYMSDMEHPVFTAIFEKKVNIAVSPEGAGYARYYVAEKVFRAKPRDNGWRFIGWKYVADEWTVPVNYTSTDATWPMENPQTTGTYTAYFEENPLYSITLEQPENFGTFSVSVNGTQNAVSAYAGDTVTLSLAPVLGYGIDSPVFTPAGGEPQRIYRDNNTGLYSFKMPEADVSVSLSFRLFGPASFTIPSACTSIEKSTFEETTALTVVDASHVTAIGPDAFSGCTGLTQIRLPADCAIDASAFTSCGTVYVFAAAGGTTESGCEGIANCIFVEEPQN